MEFTGSTAVLVTQLLTSARSLMAAAVCAVVLACLVAPFADGASRTETRTFVAVGFAERPLTFRLVGMKPESVRRARLVSGRRVVAVPLASARRGARRGVLRLPLSVLGSDRPSRLVKPVARRA